MALNSIPSSLQKELDETISQRLEELRGDALDRYRRITGNPRKLQSMHGTIGGKNNTYVDAVRTQFLDFKDFLARWIQGLLSQAKSRDAATLRKYGRAYRDSSAHRIIDILKDPVLREYTFTFLERNFYRNHLERTRAKPDETLWQLWFGDNHMCWGLILAPVYCRSSWVNDRSEIRRARYHYWTVGHVLETGLIDPDSDTPYTFSNLRELLKFYRSILKRVSNSLYEKAIADKYIEYLEDSSEPLDEPFLIPELRYAGLENPHKHRLDYTVLNPHVMEYTGFELSPHSTHYALKGIKTKTQKAVNRELAERWAKEMDKRNDYFSEFGITTITFTDNDLADVDGCFESIAERLSKRPKIQPRLATEVAALEEYLREIEDSV